MRLSREVKVGFLTGPVGRVSPFIIAVRASCEVSPLGVIAELLASEDSGVVSFCELNDEVDAVCAGDGSDCGTAAGEGEALVPAAMISNAALRGDAMLRNVPPECGRTWSAKGPEWYRLGAQNSRPFFCKCMVMPLPVSQVANMCSMLSWILAAVSVSSGFQPVGRNTSFY